MRAIPNYQLLVGCHVTPTKFQGVSSLGQLEAFGLERPSKLERRTQAELRSDQASVVHGKEIRDRVQRRFNKPRLERADLYAAYIQQVEGEAQDPALGGTPAITLYAASTSSDDLLGEDGLHLPWSTPLVAIDGETQTEARFIVADRVPESRNWPIAITVYHGVSEEFARQILHDYNRYAHPVAENETSAFNRRGPITRAAWAALRRAGVKDADINQRGTKGTKKHVMAWTQVFNLAAGAYHPDQTLRGRVAASYLSAVNAQLNAKMPESVVDALSEVIADVQNGNAAAGGLVPMVWQVAGAIVGNSPRHTRLNWNAARETYNDRIKKGSSDRTPMTKVGQIDVLRQALLS